MKVVTFILLFSFVSTSFAADFSERVKVGNDVSSSPAGKSYERSLGPIFQEAMLVCIPPGSTGHLGEFALVGTISALGNVSNVEVRPSTTTSVCFAEQVERATFPEPPSAPYPLTVEMNVVP